MSSTQRAADLASGDPDQGISGANATSSGNGTESPEHFARGHKRFDHLWTPHRMVYIDGENKPEDEGPGEQCPFCRVPGEDDEKGLIVTRGEHCYVVMNLYPYNSGHLLICPYRHVADYTDLTPEEVVEIADFTRTAMRAMRAISEPSGFNLGMNQGAVAGAGIAGHLHQHVVPRWFGDANFLPVIAETKALPQLLGETRELLANVWATQAAESVKSAMLHSAGPPSAGAKSPGAKESPQSTPSVPLNGSGGGQ